MLHVASAVGLLGHLHTAQLLVECGAEVDVRRSSGRTPRKAAIALGHLWIAEFLSECGTSL